MLWVIGRGELSSRAVAFAAGSRSSQCGTSLTLTSVLMPIVCAASQPFIAIGRKLQAAGQSGAAGNARHHARARWSATLSSSTRWAAIPALLAEFAAESRGTTGCVALFST